MSATPIGWLLPTRLFGGVRVTNAPSLANLRRLDGLVIPMGNRMENNGIAIDKPYFHDLSAELGSLAESYYADIKSHIPRETLDLFINETVLDDDDERLSDDEDKDRLNIDSPEQLADLLFNHMGLGTGAKLKTTKSGKYISTGKKTLETIKAENPIIGAILKYREVVKLKSTYCDKFPRIARWHPESETWRIHFQLLLTRTETGRAASKNPNLQNIPARSKLGQKLRAGFIAAPGKVLLSRDLSQIELRVMAHEADEANMIDIFMRDGDLHVETTLRAHKMTWDDWNALGNQSLCTCGHEHIKDSNGDISRKCVICKCDDYIHSGKKQQSYLRTPVKNTNFGICIAEGQRVLTDTRGLVPIESVLCCDKVWDGVEFVSHEGVIFKGWREVITYDGLTATPDHNIWTQDGRKTTLKKASKSGSGLAVTAAEECPIRFPADYFDTDRKGRIRKRRSDALRNSSMVSLRNSSMHRMRRTKKTDRRQYSARSYKGLYLQKKIHGSKSLHSGRTLYCHGSAVQESKRLQLPYLWRTRNRMPVQIAGSVHRFHNDRVTASYLQKSRHRPYRQQRSLRAWKSETSYKGAKSAQYQTKCMAGLQGRENYSQRFMGTTERRLPGIQTGQASHSTAGETGVQHREYSCEKTEGAIPEKKYARVYDILNAGPRRRFTAEGKLVSNCYGLSGLGLQQQLASQSGIYWTEEQCDKFIELWFSLYPGVKAYMDRIYDMAYRFGMVWDAVGRTRLVPGIKSVHKQVRAAALRESGNMPIQGQAGAILKLGMAECEAESIGYRDVGIYLEPLIPIHDEIVWEVDEDYVDCISDHFGHIMNNVVKLKVPLKSEAGYGKRWKK